MFNRSIERVDDIVEFLTRVGFQNSEVTVGNFKDFFVVLVSEWMSDVQQFKHVIRVRWKEKKSKYSDVVTTTTENYYDRYIGVVTLTKFPKPDIEVTFYDYRNRVVVPNDRRIIRSVNNIKSALRRIYRLGK